MLNKKNMGIIGLVVIVVAAYLGNNSKEQYDYSSQKRADSQPHSEVILESKPQKTSIDRNSSSQRSNDNEKIQHAFQQQKSNVQVHSEGQVKAILSDDNEGSRHQKFILKLSNGHTVLVAHNIDLSPRINDLKKGEVVEFNGEYEYSHQGGVIHWTHHDPQKNHVDGWLKYNGKIYQ